MPICTVTLEGHTAYGNGSSLGAEWSTQHRVWIFNLVCMFVSFSNFICKPARLSVFVLNIHFCLVFMYFMYFCFDDFISMDGVRVVELFHARV